MAVRLEPCDLVRLRLLAEDRLPPDEVAGLEDHLQHCAHCREALDGLAGGEPWLEAVRHYLGADPTDPYESGPDEEFDEPLGFLAPTDWPESMGRLGCYEVKGVIGRGGMGMVLKAFDPALSRNVAIKVLSTSLATCGTARRRFLREAKATAAVAHEHVVAVFSVVEPAGLPFLVMEYVPGGSLQDRIDRQGPLSLEEVLRIGMQTAAGLAAAHAQGLVHRDVKPANILMEHGVERVKLTDFGLARAVGRRRHDPERRGRRHAALHGPRAGSRRGHRPSRRSVQPGQHALCHVCRPSAVPRRDAAGRAAPGLRR